jgi:hypothetical protein
MSTCRRPLLASLEFVVLVGVLVGPSAPLQAQTASEHFPNDDGAANVQVAGTMDLMLKEQNVGPIRATVALSVGETGQQVAVDAAHELCLEASTSPGIVCDDPTCTFPIGASKSVTCTRDGTGFSLTRLNTQVSFTVAPTGTNKIQALNCRTSSGNTHGSDLLERVLVRVEPNGVHGNVAFRVHHFQGGANPRSFTVNTTGLSDQALHDAIAAGYNGVNLGLTAITRSVGSCFLSAASETIGGSFVEVSYSPVTQSSLLDFEVDGLRSGNTVGQQITLETSGPPDPTLAQCPVGDLLFGADKATLTWGFPPSGCNLPEAFDVVRAQLGCYCSNCTTCLGNDGADTIVDATVPAPGQGFWYLTRVSSGTWNGPGTSQRSDYDIAPLAPTCVP